MLLSVAQKKTLCLVYLILKRRCFSAVFCEFVLFGPLFGMKRFFPRSSFTKADHAGFLSHMQTLFPEFKTLFPFHRLLYTFCFKDAHKTRYGRIPLAIFFFWKDFRKFPKTFGAFYFIHRAFSIVLFSDIIFFEHALFFIFSIHPGYKTFVRKTEILVVPDNYMLMNIYSHDPASKQELSRYGGVFPGGPRIAGWMVVGKNKRRGPLINGCRHNFPGIDRT